MIRAFFAGSLVLSMAVTMTGAAELKTTTPTAGPLDPIWSGGTAPALARSEPVRPSLPPASDDPAFSVLRIPASEAAVDEDSCVCSDGPGPCYRYIATLEVAGWKLVSATLVVTYEDS